MNSISLIIGNSLKYRDFLLVLRVQSSINKAPKRVSFLLSKTKLAADARALFYLVKMKLPIIEELELFSILVLRYSTHIYGDAMCRFFYYFQLLTECNIQFQESQTCILQSHSFLRTCLHKLNTHAEHQCRIQNHALRKKMLGYTTER